MSRTREAAATSVVPSHAPREVAFQVFGRTMAGLQWGDPAGEPTFALHGWLDNANTFNRLAPRLPELNLVALDFAGHGRSYHYPVGTHTMVCSTSRTCWPSPTSSAGSAST